jgi:hypothetical protein
MLFASFVLVAAVVVVVVVAIDRIRLRCRLGDVGVLLEYEQEGSLLRRNGEGLLNNQSQHSLA